jgi:ribosomal protein S18 acetylase RimI-like enzyme
MAEIDELFVLPDYRGSGAGTALLQIAEVLFAQNGCRRVQLQLGRANEAARKFYRRHGYDCRSNYELLDKPLTG